MANNDDNKKGKGGIWGVIIVSIIAVVMVVIILAWATAGWKNWNPEKWFNSWGTAQTQPDDKQDGDDPGKEPETPHAHTFETTKWINDSKNHWHASTCGHDIVSDLSAHVYNENDVVCAVCGYTKPEEPEQHKHTFDNSIWESDEANHWHPSTCGHDIVKDIAAHSFNLFDICTVCGYTKPAPPHEHLYDTSKWVSDEVNHWHAAICEHEIVKDMGPHTYKDGVCTVCGNIDLSATTHRHTFDESVWEYDYNNHWHPSTCGHNATSEPEKHKLVGGKCIYCDFDKKGFV